MQEQKVKAAVLVTGGYHTERILAQLKAQGYACLTVKPTLRHQDLVNPYFALLSKKRTPLERLLAQDQKIMALEPFFAPWSIPALNDNINESKLTQDLQTAYRWMEVMLKSVALKSLAAAGVPGISGLQQKYDEMLSQYEAQHPDLKPDFGRALVHGRELLIPFGNVFFVRVSPRPLNPANTTNSLQIATIGGSQLTFFNFSLWLDSAARFGKSPIAGLSVDDLLARLSQDLIFGRDWILDGPVVFFPQKTTQERLVVLAAGWKRFAERADVLLDGAIEFAKSRGNGGARRIQEGLSGVFQKNRETPFAIPASAAGAIGRVWIDEYKVKNPNRVIIKSWHLDSFGYATGESSEYLEHLGRLTDSEKKEVVSFIQDLYAVRARKDEEKSWYEDDREIFNIALAKAEALTNQIKPVISEEQNLLSGVFLITDEEKLKGPEVKVLLGWGIESAVILSAKLFREKVAGKVKLSAFFHELIESAGYDHAFSRGLGYQARSAKNELTLEEEGFLGRVLGPDHQRALTEWIRSQKSETEVVNELSGTEMGGKNNIRFSTGKANAVDGKIAIAPIAKYDGFLKTRKISPRRISVKEAEQEIEDLFGTEIDMAKKNIKVPGTQVERHYGKFGVLHSYVAAHAKLAENRLTDRIRSGEDVPVDEMISPEMTELTAAEWFYNSRQEIIDEILKKRKLAAEVIHEMWLGKIKSIPADQKQQQEAWDFASTLVDFLDATKSMTTEEIAGKLSPYWDDKAPQPLRNRSLAEFEKYTIILGNYISGIPEEGPFILVVKNPRANIMNRAFAKLQNQVQAVVWDGDFQALHWVTVLSEKSGIPVFANLNMTGTFELARVGDLAVVDTDEKEALFKPSQQVQEDYETRQISKEALESTYDKMARELGMETEISSVLDGV
ncbi:MAG: hypothetical protein HGA76_08350, partial [Candidatus Firestonebacteria bacterium]|nr:hypothetical protein [Candidatus Firestonebacteria bacterium]